MNNRIPLTSVLDSFLTPAKGSTNNQIFRPESDIFESDSNYLIKVNLPSVSKDDLTIELKNQNLTLCASVEQSTLEGYRSLRGERQNIINYSRTFRLGSGIDDSKIEADLSNGVLTLIIPKSEKSIPRQIKVN